MLWLVCACAVCSALRSKYYVRPPFSISRSRLEYERCSLLEPLWRVSVFFPHSAHPGCLVAQCPKLGICSVGEAIRLFRLAKRFAFPGRLSSFAALPNEGATNRLRRLEWSAISDSARAFVLSVLSILQLTSACGALVFPEFCDLASIGRLYDRRL